MASYFVGSKSRDWIQLEWEPNSADGALKKLECGGCWAWLQAAQDLRTLCSKVDFRLESLQPPQGTDHVSVLMRQLILKLTGQWKSSVAEGLLCKCRKVDAARVEYAVIVGCHTPELVGQYFSAGTGCGTCQPQIQQVIEDLVSYRSNPE